MTAHTDGPQPVIITLVHGTFARGAPWCKPDSSICKAISNTLNGNVRFETFEWSGLNLHRSRVAAGEELQLFLRQLHASTRTSKHFLIGHSHGGNVIRYAMAAPEVATSVDGVIMLATPFLNAEPRNYQKALRNLITMISVQAAIFSAIAVFALAGWLAVSFSEAQKGLEKILFKNAAIFYVWVPLLGLTFSVFKFIYLNRLVAAFDKIDMAFRARQYQLLSSTSAPIIGGIPLLSLTAIRDEAGLLLRFAQKSIDWMLKGFISIALRVFIMIVLIPLLITVPLGFGVIEYNDLNDFTDTYASMTALSLILAPLTYSLSLLPSMFFPNLYRTRVFGEEKFLDHLLVSVTTQERPIGWELFTHGQPDIDRWKNIKTLIHSRIYDDDGVLRTIDDWLKTSILNSEYKTVWVRKLDILTGAQLESEKIINSVERFLRLQNR